MKNPSFRVYFQSADVATAELTPASSPVNKGTPCSLVIRASSNMLTVLLVELLPKYVGVRGHRMYLRGKGPVMVTPEDFLHICNQLPTPWRVDALDMPLAEADLPKQEGVTF